MSGSKVLALLNIMNAIEHESELRLWEVICRKESNDDLRRPTKNNAEKRARQEIVNPPREGKCSLRH